jgi:hypothetical protein
MMTIIEPPAPSNAEQVPSSTVTNWYVHPVLGNDAAFDQVRPALPVVSKVEGPFGLLYAIQARVEESAKNSPMK